MNVKFSNKVIKRLVSALLVLAMVITCIPVTQAEAGTEDETINKAVMEENISDGNYQYKNDFYTIHGSAQTKDKVLEVSRFTEPSNGGSSERIMPVEGKNIGLFVDEDWLEDVPDYWVYRYYLSVEEVKRLIAGEAITLHFDKLDELWLDCERWTNVSIDQLYIEYSRASESGRKIQKRTIRKLAGNDFVVNDDLESGWNGGTDCTVKFQIASKKLYREKTSFELPEGKKGKKTRTYNVNILRAAGGLRSNTYISADGIQEPAVMINAKTGKKVKSYHWDGEGICPPSYSGAMYYEGRNLSNGEKRTYILKGLYTGRKQKFTVIFHNGLDVSSTVYKKFKKKPKLTEIHYNIMGD